MKVLNQQIQHGFDFVLSCYKDWQATLRVKGSSDESFLSTTSTARLPTCEMFSLSELQTS